MYVDNITLTADSEYGYHYFINYTDFNDGGKCKAMAGLISYDDIDKVLLDVIVKIQKIEEEEENE